MKKISSFSPLVFIIIILTVIVVVGVIVIDIRRKDISPLVQEIIEVHPKLAEHLTGGDIEFARQNPEFIKYLHENPDIIEMVLMDPNPRMKGEEVFQEFIRDKQN